MGQRFSIVLSRCEDYSETGAEFNFPDSCAEEDMASLMLESLIWFTEQGREPEIRRHPEGSMPVAGGPVQDTFRQSMLSFRGRGREFLKDQITGWLIGGA